MQLKMQLNQSLVNTHNGVFESPKLSLNYKMGYSKYIFIFHDVWPFLRREYTVE